MKIPSEAMKNVLESIGLEPEDKGSYFIVRCPACGHKESYLYKKSNKIQCNRGNKCGATHVLSDLLREHKSSIQKYRAASKLFNEESEADIREKQTTEIEIPEGVTFFNEDGNSDSIFRRQAHSYLHSRGIPESNVNLLGYIYEPQSLYNKTIFIPFYENGSIVFFICRDYTGKRKVWSEGGESSPLRYINPKGASASNFVFNHDRIREGGAVFIFEGLMDALSLDEQVGTSMNKAHLSREQASKIWNRAPGRIILVPDTDNAGQNALKSNIATLGRYKPPSLDTDILVYDIPKPYKDFNETGRHSIDINECEPYSKMRALQMFDWKIKAPL